MSLSFILLLFFSSTTKKKASYIQICGRRNPALDKCIENSVNSLMPRLKNGLPELDVPPLEPLEMKEIKLAELDDFQAVATNCKLSGLSNFTLKSFVADFDKKMFKMELTFPKVIMESDYDVKAKIIVPINEKGPIKTITGKLQLVLGT